VSDPTGVSAGGWFEGLGSALAGLAAFWVAVSRKGQRNDDAANDLVDAVHDLTNEAREQALEGNREINAQQAERIRQLEGALLEHGIPLPPRKV
jgi:hypothetical protein